MKAATWLDSGQYDISWYSSSKTEFTISTAKQFAGIAYLVNNGYTNFSGKTIKLSNDISLSGRTWVSIGSVDGTKCFKGTIDGQDNTISAISITLDVGKYPNYGLFCYLSNAKISNLNLSGSVDLEYGEEAYKVETTAGLLASVASSTTFENVSSTTSTFKYSRLRTQGAYSYRISLGGLIGESDFCYFTNCTYNGDFNFSFGVTGSGNANHNGGSVYIGGIVGYVRYGTFKYCGVVSNLFSASLSSSKEHKEFSTYIGGIAGYISHQDSEIYACYSNITSFKTSLPRTTYGSLGSARFSIGGISGHTSFALGVGHIINCYSSCNSISVGGQAANFGGIVGYSDESKSSNSYEANFCASDISDDAENIYTYDGYFGSTTFSKSQMKTQSFLNELNLFPNLNDLDYRWTLKGGNYPRPAELVEPESITISPTEISIGINETYQLEYILLPEDATSNVTWKSSDETVATVSETGEVRGKKVGRTLITATTANGLTSKVCNVSVTERHLINGIRYEIDKDGYAYVCPLESGKYSGSIEIPKQICIDEKSYYVEGIGINAFKECTQLLSITLPEGLEICQNAFYGCTGLTEIFLNKVQIIDESAFEKCTGLKSVEITIYKDRYGVNSYYSQNAFSGCYNLTKVEVDDLASWVEAKFYGNIYANPLCPGRAELYVNGKKIVNLSVPIPKTKKLEFATFIRCSSIATATLQEGIEEIGGGRDFQGCSNLSVVNLPSTLKKISGYAFAYCNNIETVNCYASTPPNMQSGWNDLDFSAYFAFYASSPEKITLHAPKGCKQAYLSAPGWNLFGVIIEDLEASVENIIMDEKNDISDVYNQQGILVKKNASQDDINALPSGIYIVHGKKIFIK